MVKSQGGTVIHKAEATVVGAPRSDSAGGTPVDMEKLEKDTKALSFKELNRMRVDFGDLPASLI